MCAVISLVQRRSEYSRYGRRPGEPAWATASSDQQDVKNSSTGTRITARGRGPPMAGPRPGRRAQPTAIATRAGRGRTRSRGLAVAGPVQRAHRPVAGAAKNRKSPSGEDTTSRGELAGRVEQAHVGAADRRAAQDTFRPSTVSCRARRRAAPRSVRCSAAVSRPPHLAPVSTGTPTSEPYSVHEPS